MTQYKTIAESNNFIVLDQYNKFVEEPNAGYQTEGALSVSLFVIYRLKAMSIYKKSMVMMR